MRLDIEEGQKEEKVRLHRRHGGSGGGGGCVDGCCDDVSKCATRVTCCLGKQVAIVLVIALVLIGLVVALIFVALKQFAGLSSAEAASMMQQMVTTAVTRIMTASGFSGDTHRWVGIADAGNDAWLVADVTASATGSIVFNVTLGRALAAASLVLVTMTPDPARLALPPGGGSLVCADEPVACRLLTRAQQGLASIAVANGTLAALLYPLN